MSLQISDKVKALAAQAQADLAAQFARIDAITAADIQQVAQETFAPGGMTTLIYHNGQLR